MGMVSKRRFIGRHAVAAAKRPHTRDAVAVLARPSDVIAMQALRPLSMSAALDLVLAHPQWREHLDATQIGGFGASMGGETVMLMGGASLTTSPGLASSPVGADPRIKAAVGYVPYFGQPLLPAFGRDQRTHTVVDDDKCARWCRSPACHSNGQPGSTLTPWPPKRFLNAAPHGDTAA